MTDSRRKFLKRAVGLCAAFGAGMASIPFVRSLSPSQRTLPNAPETIEFPKLEPGQILAHTTPWYSTLYILRRSDEMIRSLEDSPFDLVDPDSVNSRQPMAAKNTLRSIKPEYLVVEGECTHLGCNVAFVGPGESPYYEAMDRVGGFFCPCHGSSYDTAGRVTRNSPAPTNLVVPDHEFVSESSILLNNAKRS